MMNRRKISVQVTICADLRLFSTSLRMQKFYVIVA